MKKTEWIFNPELTEGDREKIYDNGHSNYDGWEWCKHTEKAFKEGDAEALIDHYGDNGYIEWLKEWRIIIPKPTESDWKDTAVRPSTEEIKEGVKSRIADYKLEITDVRSVDKSMNINLNDDPGYLRLKIRELEEKVKRLKSEHSDIQNRLEQSKQILEHTEKTLNQESNNWYIKYKEVNTKLGALQDVLNGIRIMIGG